MTAALRRRWWLPVLAALLGATVGFLVVHTVGGPRNVSVSQVLLSVGSSTTRRSSAQAEQYVNQRTYTAAEFVTSDDVLRPAARDVGVAVPDLAPEVSASAVGDSTAVGIAVRGSSPENARRSAQAVTASFVRALVALETPVPGEPTRMDARVVSAASLPAAAPSPVPAVLLGAAAGVLLVAAAVACLTSGPARRAGDRIRGRMTAEPVGPAGNMGS